MIKLLRMLLALVGLVLIVVLAVDNRGPVEIVFWPLPFTYRMPLYAVFLLGLGAGALLGGAAVWLSGLARRSEARASCRIHLVRPASLADRRGRTTRTSGRLLAW